MRAVTQYLKSRGFGCVDDSWYSLIHLWQSWYQGKVPAFHCYRQYNGRRKVTRTRKTLGMAKTIPEDWANLALNEKVDIVVSEATVNERVHQVLEDNNFRVRANQLLELAFALGAGAFVEYLDRDRVRIDYVRAGLIYPLVWDNGEVLDCAFASERAAGQEKQLTLTIHRRDEHGFYLLENHLFRRQGNVLTELDLPEGVKPEVNTGSAVPLFQLIRPNIVNNVDLNCPMGISVFANAIDQLEGVDLVYDSYQNEFRLGRKRITVPVTMARIAMEEDGSAVPVFDDNDTEFYAVPSMEGAENKIVEHNMELRHEAHEAAIKSGLAQTGGVFENLTRTTAHTATKQFENALDRAWLQIASGGFDYNAAIRKTIKDLARQGVASVTYPSGHTDALEVAVRRAVVTGCNQTAAKAQIALMDELGTDLVETTAYRGARPSHAGWQGQIFSRSGRSGKYPDFVSSTGYGTGPGLCGWNCSHSFGPYVEGAPRAYSPALLERYESQTVTYNGKDLTLYEAGRQQRYIERQIRRWKREYAAMGGAGLDAGEAAAKLSAWRAREKDFCQQTGLKRQGDRSQVA